MSCYTRFLHLPATTSPASPASTISSYNRFLAFSMTAPQPEKSISGGYRPTGLRRALEWARLPAGCCLCEQYSLGGPWGCPKDWGYEDSVPSRHKKSSLSDCYFCAGSLTIIEAYPTISRSSQTSFIGMNRCSTASLL